MEVSAAVEGGGFLRTLKRKSEVNSKGYRGVCLSVSLDTLSPPSYSTPMYLSLEKASSQLVNNEHTLQTFQRILKLQCDALISLGLDPSLKVSPLLALSVDTQEYVRMSPV